jgi:hypothetical protein
MWKGRSLPRIAENKNYKNYDNGNVFSLTLSLACRKSRYIVPIIPNELEVSGHNYTPAALLREKEICTHGIEG